MSMVLIFTKTIVTLESLQISSSLKALDYQQKVLLEALKFVGIMCSHGLLLD
jgi:hypothetical protein